MADKEIELGRHDYRAEGIKGESFFGPGWPFGAAALITIIVGTLIHEASAPVWAFGAIAGAALVGIFQQFYR